MEATNHETGDNPVIAIRWAHVFSANTLLEVKGGGLPNINSREDPVTDDFDTPGHYDWGTGMSTVNNSGSWMSHQRKTQVAAALTHYADDFIKGSHDFKFGVQILRSFDTSFWKYSGDVYYYDYYGEAYYAVYSESAAYGATVDSNAGFINDNWTLTDRLTLNLGFRFDHMKSGIPDLHQRDSALKNETDVVFPGKGDVIDFKHFSPRLGFTLQLDEAAKTVAKASLGRYYGKLAANWIKYQSTGNTPTFAFFYNEDTGKYDIPYWDYFPSINLGTDPNLKNQYTDTLFVGVEREIIPEVRLDVSFIYKKEHDFVRVKDVAGEYEELPHVDEFEGQTQILPVFNRTSPSTQSQYWSTNRDDFKQSYKSLVVQANKRWSRGWTLNGSYQWQRALSTGGSSFTNQGRSGFGADPNDLTNAYGRARFDATHSAKLSTAIELPFGITTGIRYTYADGLPLYRQIRVGGLSQGGQNVVAETRGSYKLDTVHDLAIRLDKDFRFQENKRIRLAVDIFNVFNMANAINVRTNSSTAGEDFLQATEVPLPRRIQLAIRFQF